MLHPHSDTSPSLTATRDTPLPRTFLLLQQEGHLIHSALTNGLTALSRANVHDKGNCYAAFFQLSIGMERLMKAALFADYLVSNDDSPPPNLRSKGHDLERMLDDLQTMGSPAAERFRGLARKGTIGRDILHFLNCFGRRTRYFNLDGLTSSSDLDPLQSWNRLMSRILTEEVPERTIKTVLGQSEFAALCLENQVRVSGHDLERKPLTLVSSLAQPRLQAMAIRRAVVHVIDLIRPFERFFDELFWAASRTHNGRLHADNPPIPLLSEFLRFVHRDRPSIMKKTRWP